MNINLNLATRPYIELRSVYARLRVLAVILAVIALPMFLVMHLEEAKAAAAQARAAELQENIETLREQQAHARALVLEGPNAATIHEIDFLNQTFRQKSFSWTATMADLETVLPYGVAVRGIEPLLAPDGHVLIRLRVDGPREQAIAVIRNLEHSRHFIAPRLVQETEVTDQNKQGNRLQPVYATAAPATPQVRFDILSDYRPLPNSHDAAGVRAAKAEQAEAADQAIPSVRAAHPSHHRMHRPVIAKPTPGAAIHPAGGVPMTRRTNLLSKLNVHIAVVAVLLIVDLFLTTRVIVAWHESHSDTSSQYQADLATYAQLQTKSARLRALPSELAASRKQAQAFIDTRIPDNDSAILAELGALKDANHVVLSQSHYSYRPALPGLVELRIEAGLSGQYDPIMHFINGLERDKDHAYFTIRSITLSGQQGGLVNLRIAITTYMRSTPAETNALRQNTRDAGQEAQ